MRIAVIANWWYRRGGLGGVMLDEAAALQARGHVILPFAAAHPDNLDATTSRYFPPFIETSDGGRGLPVRRRIGAMRDIVDNRDAAARFDALVSDMRPDVVHVHNTTRQLSPSVLAVATRHRLPVVMTMHDYGLICPQGLLLRGGSSVCDPPLCAAGNTLHAVRHRCIKGSAVASAAGAFEAWTHRRRGSYSRTVQVLIAPSRFIRKLVRDDGGWAGPIRYLPNGIPDIPVPTTRGSAGPMLFVGRLVREKGVDVLLEAARANPAIDVVIAGDGPELARLRSTAPASVRFVGQQSTTEIARLLGGARALIVPSIWFENAPLSILEAMRAGIPVIASDLGGSSELISGGAGLLVPAGDVPSLALAMRRLANEPALAADMGARGRLAFEERFTLDRHVDGLLEIYDEAIAGPGSSARSGPDDPSEAM